MFIEERTLDLNKQYNRAAQIKPIILRCGENNQTQLKLNIVDNSLPYSLDGLTATFCAFTSAENWVKDANNTKVSGNVITYTVQSNLTSSAGEVKIAYVELKKGEQVLTTDGIPIIVLADVDMTAAEAKEYQSTIDYLIDALEDAIQSADDATSKANNAASEATKAADKANSAINKVVSSKYEYQTSASGSTPPTGAWSTTPNIVQGQYLWTRTTTTYESGSSVVSYSVAYEGKNGEVLGDERLTAVEEKVDSINDYTTGINLLRGTKDFRVGTELIGTSAASNGYMDGFYIPTNCTRIKDADGFDVIVTPKNATASPIAPLIAGMKSGDKFTVSYEVMYETDGTFNSNIDGYPYIGYRNLENTSSYTSLSISSADMAASLGIPDMTNRENGKWYKFVHTYTVPDLTDEFLVRVSLNKNSGYSNDTSIQFRKLKVEIGSINHPIWSPSPFDTDYINDMTTGVNLLRGTRDFFRGTEFEISGNTWAKNGWYIGSGYQPYASYEKDSEGYTILAIKPNGGNCNVYSSNIYCDAVKSDFVTVVFDVMFEDVSKLTHFVYLYGRRSGGSAGGSVTLDYIGMPVPQDQIEPGKWYHYEAVVNVSSIKQTDIWFNLMFQGSNGYTNTYFKKAAVYDGAYNNCLWSQDPLDVVDAPALHGRLFVTGEDLDTMYDEGWYYSDSQTLTSSLHGVPSGVSAAHLLMRIKGYSRPEAKTNVQIIYCLSGTGLTTLERKASGDGVYTSWQQQAYKSDITAANLQGVVPVEKGGSGFNDYKNSWSNFFDSSINNTESGLDSIPTNNSYRTFLIRASSGVSIGDKIPFYGTLNRFRYGGQLHDFLWADNSPRLAARWTNEGTAKWGSWETIAFLSDLTALTAQIATLQTALLSSGAITQKQLLAAEKEVQATLNTSTMELPGGEVEVDTSRVDLMEIDPGDIKLGGTE